MSKQPRFLIHTAIAASILLSADSSANSEAYYWQNFAGQPGGPGNVDGTREKARFNKPNDVVVAPNGNIFIADLFNNSIRMMTPDGQVSTFAGSPVGENGSRDGTGTEALFSLPSALDMDAAGNLFVADGQTVRKVTPEGLVTTLAGKYREFGTADGGWLRCTLRSPRGDRCGLEWESFCCRSHRPYDPENHPGRSGDHLRWQPGAIW